MHFSFQAVNSLTLDYTALKKLLSSGMCEHQAYKQKVESNMCWTQLGFGNPVQNLRLSGCTSWPSRMCLTNLVIYIHM